MVLLKTRSLDDLLMFFGTRTSMLDFVIIVRIWSMVSSTSKVDG